MAFIQERFIIVSLANTGLYKDYTVSSIKDILEAYADFESILEARGLGDTDTERQMLEGVCNDRTIDQLEQLLELIEQYNEELEFIHSLLEYYSNIEDVRNILESGCYSVYEGDSQLDAFIGYCEDLGTFSQVPESLQAYIDYEKYMRDCMYNGMTVIEVTKPQYRRYIFISY